MEKTMTTSAMTDRQIERAVEIFRAQLRKHASQLPSDAVQKVFGQPELGPEWVKVLCRRVEALKVLTPKGVVTITLTERHDPDEYYQTRSGLYVWGDFRSRIVAHAKPVETGMTFRVEGLDLMKDLTDEEIEASLPKEHLFGDSRLCAIIAELIAKQSNGEEGMLLNNGHANLFYTASCVVRVYWACDHRRWYVNTWKRDGYRWNAGHRVFSPAN